MTAYNLDFCNFSTTRIHFKFFLINRVNTHGTLDYFSSHKLPIHTVKYIYNRSIYEKRWELYMQITNSIYYILRENSVSESYHFSFIVAIIPHNLIVP